MKFLDKIKDLFSDEEEVTVTKEVETVENEEHKLPTFMRNKIEEEEKRIEEKKQKEDIISSSVISDRDIIKTRSNNSFSFPIEMDESDIDSTRYVSNQNVLVKEREKPVAELYTKKEEAPPRRFKPTPVISPVYGVLDKNYTKDEVKLQDENSYEIQRPSRKVDFETVRNKAFGSLTDDIRNNLCENCELYKEVKITKNADKKMRNDDSNLLADMTEDDISIGDAEDNYFDFGVKYEIPKKEDTVNKVIVNTHELEINNDIKIVNHNEGESTAEKIEVKEDLSSKLLEDTKEFEKMTHDEEDINEILKNTEDITSSSNEENDPNDIFNLIDSMYDEEGK